MAIDEPEPCPRDDGSLLLRTLDGAFQARISRCFKTYYQLLQLATEVAGVGCYFSQCAPYFLRLAEGSRLQAGVLIDLVISSGGVVHLPTLDGPCRNLSHDREDAEPSLAAALEACLQLEGSKNFEALHARLLETKNVRAQHVVEAMTVACSQKQEELARLVSMLLHASTKLEGLALAKASMGL